MRRRLIALTALALLAAACTAGGGSSEPVQTLSSNASHAPLTLTVWSNFTSREHKVTTDAMNLAHQKYPWMTIKHVGGKEDAPIERAISGGNPPDVAISFTPDNAAKYCQTGAGGGCGGGGGRAGAAWGGGGGGGRWWPGRRGCATRSGWSRSTASASRR